MAKKNKLTAAQLAKKHGYKSGLEDKIAEQISVQYELDLEYVKSHLYEFTKMYFIQPEKKRFYKPDFILPNKIIIETKGRFMLADRQKHLWVKEQYPDADIRFVFTNPNAPLKKGAKTSYADWCDKFGFKYAKGSIPPEWFL